MRESQSGTAFQAVKDSEHYLSEGILSFVEYAPRLLIVLPSRQFTDYNFLLIYFPPHLLRKQKPNPLRKLIYFQTIGMLIICFRLLKKQDKTNKNI